MKKQFLIFALAATLLAGCSNTSGKINFGTAGVGGTYHSFGQAFANTVTASSPQYTFEVKTTAGSAANLRLLSENYIQMAVAQTDLANDAYFGKGTFEGTQYQGYGAVTGLYTEACQIVVRADSDIYTIEDLLGKKVSIGETESGTEQNARQILMANGLSSDMVEMVNLNYTDAAGCLLSGQIDAFFCTAGTQTIVIENLATECSIRLLEIDEKCAQKLMSAYGFYTEYTIPAGTYTGQTEDVATLGIRSILLASSSLSDDTVKNLLQTYFESEQALQDCVSAGLQFNKASAAEGITIPFHPGAAAYFRECGIEVNADNTDSK